jgi:hypothetical protein
MTPRLLAFYLLSLTCNPALLASVQAGRGRDLGEVTIEVLPLAEVEVPELSELEPPEPASVIDDEPDPAAETTAIAGDCDHSGSLTVADAQCALDMSAGLRVFDLLADVDGDFEVTSADARHVLQQVLRGGS